MNDFAAWRVFDNPFRARALRVTYRPGRLAMTAAAHAAVLLTAVIIVHTLCTSVDRYGRTATDVPFGRLLLAVLGCLEAVFITLTAPLAGAAILHPDRRHRCLDQLTACGLAPTTICWGHLTAFAAVATLHLLCALPFFGIAVIVGRMPIQSIAATYAVLWSYALAFFVLGMAVGIRQGVGAVVSLFLAVFFCTMWSFSPNASPVSAALMPARALIENALRGHPPFDRSYPPPPAGLFAVVPLWCVSCSYYVLIAGFMYLYLMLGPDLRLDPGANDFDALIMGRSKKRRRLKPTTKNLLRQVQLVFLYENQPLWLRRWSTRLRECVWAAAAAGWFALVAPVSRTSWPAPPPAPAGAAAADILLGTIKTGYAAAPARVGSEAISFYMILTMLWLGLFVPYFQSKTRLRIQHALDYGLKRPSDSPLFWQAAHVIIPFVVLGAAAWNAGAWMFICAPFTLGLWATFAVYSFAVGSLVAMFTVFSPLHYTRRGFAFAIVTAFALGPYVPWLLFFFGAAPAWSCYAGYASLLTALFDAFDPGRQWTVNCLRNEPFFFNPAWQATFLIYAAAAALALRWRARAIRRFREREEALRHTDDPLDAGE